MNNIKDIDVLIKETLSKEEASFYDSLEEQNVFEQLFGLYKGKNAWFLIISNILTIAFLGLLIYCLMQFFKVENTADLVKWGLASLFLLINICMLKIYAWMQMDKSVILREMKRLELLVMSTTEKKA